MKKFCIEKRSDEMGSYLILSILAGVLAVDDRAGWQSLIAQPVFIGTIVGLFMGEPYAGLAVGLALELIWLSVLPMRGSRRPDQVIATVVGSGVACELIRRAGIPSLNFFAMTNPRFFSFQAMDARFILIVALGSFLGLLSGGMGLALTAPFYEMRENRINSIDLSQGSLSPAKLNLIHLGSMVFIFAVESSITFALLFLAGKLAGKALHWGAGSLMSGAGYWYLLLPVMGAAALIQVYWHKNAVRFLLFSIVLVLILFAI